MYVTVQHVLMLQMTVMSLKSESPFVNVTYINIDALYVYLSITMTFAKKYQSAYHCAHRNGSILCQLHLIN